MAGGRGGWFCSPHAPRRPCWCPNRTWQAKEDKCRLERGPGSALRSNSRSKGLHVRELFDPGRPPPCPRHRQTSQGPSWILCLKKSPGLSSSPAWGPMRPPPAAQCPCGDGPRAAHVGHFPDAAGVHELRDHIRLPLGRTAPVFLLLNSPLPPVSPCQSLAP